MTLQARTVYFFICDGCGKESLYPTEDETAVPVLWAASEDEIEHYCWACRNR